jgi:hypothetical protein
VAGGLQSGILRRLHRHGGTLAEGAVEHDALASRRRELLQHAARANMFRYRRVGCMQRARDDAVLFALAFLAQVDDGDVGAAAERCR